MITHNPVKVDPKNQGAAFSDILSGEGRFAFYCVDLQNNNLLEKSLHEAKLIYAGPQESDCRLDLQSQNGLVLHLIHLLRLAFVRRFL